MHDPVIAVCGLQASIACDTSGSESIHIQTVKAKSPCTNTSIPSVSVAPECISTFNELKLGKDTKWIIYKISDDWKEIVVEETSKDPDYSAFREKLLNAKSKDKKGKEGIGGRYAVFDVQSGEGTRNKITFISWCPDDAPQYVSV